VSLVGSKARAASGPASMAARKLESFILGKEDEEVNYLAIRMGMVGVGGESGFAGVVGTGVAGGRPKVEFDVAEGPAHEGDPDHRILITDAGAYCYGVIYGGAKVFLAPTGDCVYQSHQKKALVNLNAVYLTAGDPRICGKTAGYTGWCAREVVFGNSWGELEDLAMVTHAFRCFGDTLDAMYDVGEDPVGTNWSTLVVSVSRPTQVGTPKHFQSCAVDQSTPTVTSALKIWDKGTRVEAVTDEEDEEAYRSVTNLSFNQELLHEVVVDVYLREKQQANHQSKETEVLGNQLHDARIGVGTDPGVFTDPDDSVWDSIYVLYAKQEQLEGNMDVVVD
jgi:hypothetical protein